MENFQYSVQLSDQDWAEFSAATEECGLLQASLASGDELLSSDIDQGDSSGSSPPGPRPLLGGSGWPGFEEEDQAATKQLVSRSWQEPALALGAGQQTPSTSAQSEARGSAPTPPLGSPLLSAARPDEVRGPARSRGKGPSAGSAEQTSGAGQDERGLESAGAPEQVARPGLDLSTPVLTTEQGSDPLSMTPRAGPHAVATPAPEPGPDFSMAKSDPALSTPASKPHPDTTPSTPASKPHPDTTPSTSACEPHPDTTPSTPACEPHPDTTPSTPTSEPHPDTAPCTPTCQPGLDVALPPPGRKVEPQVDSSAPALKAECDMGAPTLASVPQAGPDSVEAKGAPQAKLDLGSVVSSGGHQEKPRGEPSAGAPGHPSGEPPPGPVPAKKKKVRFSVSEPSPKEPGSEEATRPLSPATGWPSAPRTATGGRGGPGPPAASATAGPGYKSCFAVTVPEAYEFFFCDTIEEEDEEAEEAEAGGAQVQWPEVCEFFFRDSRAKRSGPRGGHSPAPAPEEKKPDPAPEPSPVATEQLDLVLRQAGACLVGPMACPGPGNTLSRDVSQRAMAGGGGRPGGWSEPGGGLKEDLGRKEQFLAIPGHSPGGAAQVTQGFGCASTVTLNSGPDDLTALPLASSRAGEPWGPLTSFTFSQKDMCLVFVAFATWAVRTSDLHTPDAWKTVLLANIGTISAIRYFRRQVRLGRRSPSP
ncbi:PREDICTED: PGC-1 and ERR-induced regulator in muscle protein 1 [Myotis brandtii]|uniref:PGC-1 and ERR-induced regulator in muscle protein 1 n=1 Tax=Myotis brandtii TaxID=109478 RepID=UPI000703EFB4|nr:PREDICTED: PGC-1 and ERR-induced regulator in muscle protein 1 [Myotis brandtii]